MLKTIELENFKAFGERTRIELAPITLILEKTVQERVQFCKR